MTSMFKTRAATPNNSQRNRHQRKIIESSLQLKVNKNLAGQIAVISQWWKHWSEPPAECIYASRVISRQLHAAFIRAAFQRAIDVDPALSGARVCQLPVATPGRGKLTIVRPTCSPSGFYCRPEHRGYGAGRCCSLPAELIRTQATAAQRRTTAVGFAAVECRRAVYGPWHIIGNFSQICGMPPPWKASLCSSFGVFFAGYCSRLASVDSQSDQWHHKGARSWCHGAGDDCLIMCPQLFAGNRIIAKIETLHRTLISAGANRGRGVGVTWVHESVRRPSSVKSHVLRLETSSSGSDWDAPMRRGMNNSPPNMTMCQVKTYRSMNPP